MPIYEYECLECGTRFDKLQRFDEATLPDCPQGHSQVHRRLSQPTIIFKGSGFYVTDTGRNGNGKTSRNGQSKSREAGRSQVGPGAKRKAETSSKITSKATS